MLKKGFALKLDMSIAYDKIEWGFLRKMIRSMGFCEEWIALIMKCISSVVYIMVINARHREDF